MRDTFNSTRYPKLKHKDSSWYRNPKCRAEWLRGSKLSKKGRQIYACLELGTMNFDQEVAVVMIGKDEFRLMTVDDVARQTGLSERDIRRGMEELKRFGLGEARSSDGGQIRKGHVELCCWAEPRQPVTPDPDEEIAAARCRNSPVPEWFPEAWAPVQKDGNRTGTLWSFAKRQKIKLEPEIAAARCRNPDVIERGNEVARNLENAENAARAFMDEVSAPPVSTALYKEVRPVRPVRQADADHFPAPEHLSKPSASSSSIFSETPTTTTAPVAEIKTLTPRTPEPPPPPAAEPDEPGQVLAAMLEHELGDLAAAGDVLRDVRAIAPDATAEDVCRIVHQKAPLVRRKGKDTGYLLTCVRNAFTGDWRERKPPGHAVNSHSAEELDRIRSDTDRKLAAGGD